MSSTFFSKLSYYATLLLLTYGTKHHKQLLASLSLWTLYSSLCLFVICQNPLQTFIRWWECLSVLDTKEKKVSAMTIGAKYWYVYSKFKFTYQDCSFVFPSNLGSLLFAEHILMNSIIFLIKVPNIEIIFDASIEKNDVRLHLKTLYSKNLHWLPPNVCAEK